MEFDHIFITIKNLAEVEKACKILLQAGFTQGSDNVHAGQGTANKRFFFQNAFIEFIYPNPQLTIEQAVKEMQSPVTQATKLYERIYEVNNASPFGICFRPTNTTSKEQPIKLPFATWQYCPEYLPKSLSIPIAQAPMYEPMWFYLDFAHRPDSYTNDKRQPLNHNNNCEMITHVAVSMNAPNDSLNLSQASHCINSLDDMSVQIAEDYHMNHQAIITIDNGKQNQQIKLLKDRLILNH